ncbi:MAG: pilus assembly PilX N-terminal domain-containing protein [Patescibacteria group bacterium]|nr:pilus assembly PilX N-terminal domain-containing protein [Patescibacteria group bacterium]
MQKSFERGQTLLIVVLIMVVSLTVGLAVASRSIVNLRTSTEEENSQRAFSAAEAGVEQLLKPTSGVDTAQGNLQNKATFNAKITDVKGTSFLVNSSNPIAKDDGVDIWLTSHNSDDSLDYSSRWAGDLTVFWGSSQDACSNAAVEFILLSGQNAASAKTTRYTFEPCAARRVQNHFQAPEAGGTIGDKNFRYSKKINGMTDGIIVRVVPIYQSTPVGILGSVALPSQGNMINSTGSSGTTSRKITYFQGYPELPSELFPHILFWPTQ